MTLPIGTTIYEWANSSETPSSVYTTSNSSGVKTGDSIYDIYGQELGTVQMMELSSPYVDMYTLIGSYSGYYERNMNDTTSTTVQPQPVSVNYISRLSNGTDTYTIKDSEARNSIANLANVATTGSYNDLSNKPTIPTVPTNVSAFTNDAGYITSSALNGYATESYVTSATANMQTKGNLVTSISSASTNGQYPSAKCVYDIVGDIETLINAL